MSLSCERSRSTQVPEMMDPQQQGTVADTREAPRKIRDTNALQYKELLASRDAIDRERQKYFELFEFAPDACFLTDSHGIIREANVAASQLLGVPAQFLAGKTLPGFSTSPPAKPTVISSISCVGRRDPTTGRCSSARATVRRPTYRFRSRG